MEKAAGPPGFRQGNVCYSFFSIPVCSVVILQKSGGQERGAVERQDEVVDGGRVRL
jgi:hypothetical protein